MLLVVVVGGNDDEGQGMSVQPGVAVGVEEGRLGYRLRQFQHAQESVTPAVVDGFPGLVAV